MARGVYRGIHSSMLDDPDFQRLSAKAKHVLLTARLCRDAGPACIFRYYPEVLMRQTGYTRRQLDDALAELSRENWAYHDGTVLWIRNGLRHDPQLRLGDKKHLAAVVRQIDGLPSSSLVVKFCEYYKIRRASKGPSKTKPVQPSDTDTESDTESDPPIVPLAGDGVGPRPDSPAAPASAPQPGRRARHRRAMDSAPGEFEEFYQTYPRHVGIRHAEKAYRAARQRGATHQQLMAALHAQLSELRSRRLERVPYPASWLNGDHWRNEVATEDDPYVNYPELFDCATCGDAHETRECPKLIGRTP